MADGVKLTVHTEPNSTAVPISTLSTRRSQIASIRRLPLLIGHSATITVAVIDIETLGITKQTHQYTKVAQDKWRYLSSGTNTEVEVKVDKFGFVLDEPNNFQRVS